ncbi:LANO_0E09890g1_1 [Lachancea nothofagi CBS 11611]|uniref:LANO_0E09890g1_1 n=1 Tax=Lachancea nothofagi CBS 11611 TaxID=1266666 RepID=A0A1G4JW35_9SACH|nr:LANO_0E09890g1_1 [Lachancea nothofagi CBS 11611]
MSQGTLYGNFRIRTWVPQAIIKQFKLDIKIVAPEDDPELFARDFPLKKVPGFILPDGSKLTETIAIMTYLVNLLPDVEAKEQLAGADIQQKAQVLRWLSFANNDLLVELVKQFRPLLGQTPYVKPSVDAAAAKVATIVSVFEERLSEHTYLVTEDITLADLFATSIFARGFQYVFGSEWRAAHPIIMRWYNTVKASPYLKEFFVDHKECDTPLQPPQNNKKKHPKKDAKAPAPAEKTKATPAPAVPEQAAEQKKPKHPLETLGKATFPLDDWKRKYSNEDTRAVALPWFWEHYNPEEYTIWKVDFKYNDELTLTFMSNNQIAGFFNRLSGSIKYMFGCLVVYGENNNNGITGAVLLRGQDPVPAFDVAPDWESYEYTKLDSSKQEDKDFIENMWSWDKPVVIGGKEHEIADGKVLK